MNPDTNICRICKKTIESEKGNTPRTDYAINKHIDDLVPTAIACVDSLVGCSRQLERELDEKTNEVARLREENENLRGTILAIIKNRREISLENGELIARAAIEQKIQ